MTSCSVIEAKAAGYDDVFEYYNVKQRTETAAQNNGNETLDTRVQAMKNTLSLIQEAANYHLLTSSEKQNYVKTVSLSIGHQNWEETNVSFRKMKGALKEEVVAINKEILKRIEKAGNFAFSMLSNPENAYVTSGFQAYQLVNNANPKQIGKNYYYIYEANMHTGMDIINTKPGEEFNLVASLFLETIGVGFNGDSIKMSVIGTDVQFRVAHLDNESTYSFGEGKFINIGDTFMRYPEIVNGNSSGLHYHIDVTRDDENGKRMFVNPNTLTGGKNEAGIIPKYYMRYGNKARIPVKETRRRYKRLVNNRTSSMHHSYSDVPITGYSYTEIHTVEIDYEYKTAQDEYEWYVNTNNPDYLRTNEEGWIEYVPY